MKIIHVQHNKTLRLGRLGDGENLAAFG